MKNYTLNLFKILIDKKPCGFPSSLLETAKQKYEEFSSAEVSFQEIEKEMINFGKEIWPYLQAEFVFIDKYGQDKQNLVFLESIDPDLRVKWENFKSRGGDMKNYREGNKFEETFTGEENRQIEDALIKAQEEVEKYICELSKNERQEEYNLLVEKFKEEEKEILSKLEELRELKETGDKWDDEIEKLIYFFEMGFAELEERPTIKKVQDKIDWYNGQIEVGNF